VQAALIKTGFDNSNTTDDHAAPRIGLQLSCLLQALQNDGMEASALLQNLQNKVN
jgi:hypothetical protein